LSYLHFNRPILTSKNSSNPYTKFISVTDNDIYSAKVEDLVTEFCL